MNKQTELFLSNKFFDAMVYPDAIGLKTATAWVLSCLPSNDNGMERRVVHNMLYKLSLGRVTSPNDHTNTVFLASGEAVDRGLDFIFEKDLVVCPITESISANGNPLSRLGARVLKTLDAKYGPCEAARENAVANNPTPPN